MQGVKCSAASIASVPPVLQRSDSLDYSTALSLDNIRQSLIRQEDTIIFSLIERAQFAANDPVYQSGAIAVPGQCPLPWPMSTLFLTLAYACCAIAASLARQRTGCVRSGTPCKQVSAQSAVRMSYIPRHTRILTPAARSCVRTEGALPGSSVAVHW